MKEKDKEPIDNGMFESLLVLQGTCTFHFDYCELTVHCTCENNLTYMWQSLVETEGYSVMYFDRIVVFEEPYHCTSVTGGAHTHCLHSLDIHIYIYEACMSPAFNGSSTIRRFKHSDAIKIRDLRFLHGTATHVLLDIAITPVLE